MCASRPAIAVAALGLILAVTLPIATAADVTPLPEKDLFRPLLADPKEPRFQASIQWLASDLYDTRVGAVGFGENFGIARWQGRDAKEAWQLNLSAAVFAQFDLDAPSDDLVNADYIVGFPVSYRNDHWSVRLRYYHQSSHLGDEYLLRTHPDRVNLSFESLEMLVSYEWQRWRAYGGGEYLVSREPQELEPAILHAGIEYRADEATWNIGRLGAARLVGGLDAKAWQQHDYEVAWSLKTGLEFRPLHDIEQRGRYWQLLLEFYDGPSQYGQFYTYEVRYWGLGLVLHL